ncbi:hypothetical protein ONE63_001334 [Megalurothrips usitatus]|uniref:Carboxylesterase type B domain-containing protein n=1 Tax=Megalurothrips usitatus TaxID=439358 RepID=A0AAV7XDU3_9NEOP|nr:hypothetical protein ONE63_001334 [Megalurothrips usitatus]
MSAACGAPRYRLLLLLLPSPLLLLLPSDPPEELRVSNAHVPHPRLSPGPACVPPCGPARAQGAVWVGRPGRQPRPAGRPTPRSTGALSLSRSANPAALSLSLSQAAGQAAAVVSGAAAGGSLAGPGAGGGFSSLSDLLARKAVAAKLARYDLLLGVVRAEAFLSFSSADEQFGLEADRRSKILRSFVRNTLSFHRSEILATILNEYTDWERPVQHPVNLRDETLEALSDARVVAPAVLTADLHAAVTANRSYVYVFDYQTKYGDYQQRQGCIHGEDLPYVLGAPLAGTEGLSFFTNNFTKQEGLLSEAVMTYWTNFARTGTPSDPVEESGRGRAERSRYRNLEWPAYEPVHKKYLHLDLKPRVKTHYRAHRLSFWLHLVPELHRPGGEGVPAQHHQLADEDADRAAAANATKTTTANARTPTANVAGGSSSVTSVPAVTLVPGGGGAAGAGADGLPPEPDGFAAYSTALSATVAIGCTLLLLNMLVFACVFRQRDKHREGRGDRGSGSDSSSAGTLKKRAENGQIHASVCGSDHLQIIPGGLQTVTSVAHHNHNPYHHNHTLQLGAHLPPPDVADLPRAYATLPHPAQHAEGPASGMSTLPRTQAAPKAPKVPVKSSTLSTESERYQQQQQQQHHHHHHHHLQTLDSAGLSMMGMGTLKKRTADASMQRMDEFRV